MAAMFGRFNGGILGHQTIEASGDVASRIPAGANANARRNLQITTETLFHSLSRGQENRTGAIAAALNLVFAFSE